MALCLSLASCGSNDGLSIACVGYVKGEAGSVQNEKNGEERYILPAEFVRSFAVYTASEKERFPWRPGRRCSIATTKFT